MDAAKAAVSKLTGNRGHQTSVEETVSPAVTHEAVKPHRHEEATQAVDREVHQHHYHTTVQPLSHQEKLPEKHTHNLLPTEHREFHHDDESSTKEKLAAEMAQFKDHSVKHEAHHTQAAAPSVTGEHVHHHVHETVIPVVHKETIQPEVVHTTMPIHETHHAAAQHHGLSALPMKTLDEFKKTGGALEGGKHTTHEQYEGAPRPYNEKLSTTFEKLEEKLHMGDHHNKTSTANPRGPGVDETGSLGTNIREVDASKTHRPTDSGVSGVGEGVHTDHATSSRVGKPSLMDRLNPKVDADGDGKRGMMD